jgi:hypothetical protein
VIERCPTGTILPIAIINIFHRLDTQEFQFVALTKSVGNDLKDIRCWSERDITPTAAKSFVNVLRCLLSGDVQPPYLSPHPTSNARVARILIRIAKVSIPRIPALNASINAPRSTVRQSAER